MDTFSKLDRKIDPYKLRPDGTIDDNDRVEIGPSPAAFKLWEQRGLTPPNVSRMREYRYRRLVSEMVKRDIPALLIYDPINLRYALDATQMAIWTMHAPSRAALITADGYSTLWDFTRCRHLTSHLTMLNEVRDGGACINYFLNGDKIDFAAEVFASEVAAVIREHCGEDLRLAVDLLPVEANAAFKNAGISILHGQEILEHSRLIKGPDEILAMRCALASCEQAMQKMEDSLVPGITESELWSILQKENIALGGEWIETRLLASGPRTNPWMQECGPRVIHAGDLVGYDTDMVGNYGMCSDLSRTILCGDQPPTNEQCRVFNVAYENIRHNTDILKPGMSFVEVMDKAQRLPEEFIQQRYSVMYHGIGICDEFPGIKYHEDYIDGEYDYELQPGMTLCVECYAGAVGGREGVKLEDQVLITENGVENLTHFKFDERLLGKVI